MPVYLQRNKVLICHIMPTLCVYFCFTFIQGISGYHNSKSPLRLWGFTGQVVHASVDLNWFLVGIGVGGSIDVD